jgi:hypothetical protein
MPGRSEDWLLDIGYFVQENGGPEGPPQLTLRVTQRACCGLRDAGLYNPKMVSRKLKPHRRNHARLVKQIPCQPG